MPVKLPMQYCETCRERIINDEDLQVDYGVRWRLKNPLRRRSYLARQRKKKYANGRTVGVICASCKKPLPADAKRNQRYCVSCAHKRRNKQALDAYHAKKASKGKASGSERRCSVCNKKLRSHLDICFECRKRKKREAAKQEKSAQSCTSCGNHLSPRSRLGVCESCYNRKYHREYRRRTRGTVTACEQCGNELEHAGQKLCRKCREEQKQQYHCIDCKAVLDNARLSRCENCRTAREQAAHQRWLRQHRVRSRRRKGRVVCFWCEQEIDLSRRRHRAKDDVPRFCSRACSIADRKESGFYKRMSRAGNQKQEELEKASGIRPGTEARRAHVARLREDGKYKNYRKRQADVQ